MTPENHSTIESESHAPEVIGIGDCLLRQMDELGTNNYWEAVHLYAKREEQRGQSLSMALFGFELF